MRSMTKTPTAMTARTMTTSFFDSTTNLWSDAFLSGRGGDFYNDDNNNQQQRLTMTTTMVTMMKWLTRTTTKTPMAVNARTTTKDDLFF